MTAYGFDKDKNKMPVISADRFAEINAILSVGENYYDIPNDWNVHCIEVISYDYYTYPQTYPRRTVNGNEVKVEILEGNKQILITNNSSGKLVISVLLLNMLSSMES